MTAALTVGTMAGCSQATLNYAQELQIRLNGKQQHQVLMETLISM